MKRYEEHEVFALIEDIELLTDEVSVLLGTDDRLTAEEIDEVGGLYQRRGELLAKLNEQFYANGTNGEWQKSGQFRNAITRLQHKNNKITEKIGKLTANASQRLRESIKQRALIAYTNQS